MEIDGFSYLFRTKCYGLHPRSLQAFVDFIDHPRGPTPDEEARFIFGYAARWLQSWRVASFHETHSLELSIVKTSLMASEGA